MRLLYNLLIQLSAPVAFVQLLIRAARDPAYRDRMGERWGRSAIHCNTSLWVHAVSVGEVRAAAGLVRALREGYPGLPLIMTTATPTGARQVRESYGEAVLHVYLPYDVPRAVRRFLDRLRPVAGIVLETELWPNLYGECERRRIPLLIANARISPKSFGRYRRLQSLLRNVFTSGVRIAAQSAEDAARFRELGAAPMQVTETGNLKFDLIVPAAVVADGRALRATRFPGRTVWVAGSTRDGEEETLLDALSIVRAQGYTQASRTLLVIAPRHPARFAAVAELLARRSVPFVAWSDATDGPLAESVSVLLLDTLGQLLPHYAAADIAFVGGTLVPIGGHNLLEPAALGLPVLFGPHFGNSREAAERLLEAGAGAIVADARELAAQVMRLATDPTERARCGSAARSVVEGGQGATEKTVALAAEMIDAARASTRAATDAASR